MDLMFFQEIVCQIIRVHVKLQIIENCTPAFYIQENLHLLRCRGDEKNFCKKWNFFHACLSAARFYFHNNVWRREIISENIYFDL
jgi:hypothetical protein